jgi:hypothetical protein
MPKIIEDINTKINLFTDNRCHIYTTLISNIQNILLCDNYKIIYNYLAVCLNLLKSASEIKWVKCIHLSEDRNNANVSESLAIDS